jgi:hypothetical protein
MRPHRGKLNRNTATAFASSKLPTVNSKFQPVLDAIETRGFGHFDTRTAFEVRLEVVVTHFTRGADVAFEALAGPCGWKARAATTTN